MSGAPSTELADLAEQAYVYGFPLVFNLRQVQRYVSTGVGANPPAPFNAFSHARALATPADRFVTINNDTVYSMARSTCRRDHSCLRSPTQRPLLRAAVRQCLDGQLRLHRQARHRNRRRRIHAGTPRWAGAQPPAGVRLIEFPTHVASIVGRWAVSAPDDLRVVRALQDAVRLRPAPGGGEELGQGLPAIDDTPTEALASWAAYLSVVPSLPTPRSRRGPTSWLCPARSDRQNPAH